MRCWAGGFAGGVCGAAAVAIGVCLRKARCLGGGGAVWAVTCCVRASCCHCCGAYAALRCCAPQQWRVVASSCCGLSPSQPVGKPEYLARISESRERGIEFRQPGGQRVCRRMLKRSSGSCRRWPAHPAASWARLPPTCTPGTALASGLYCALQSSCHRLPQLHGQGGVAHCRGVPAVQPCWPDLDGC